jgi:hypothetical protein
MFQRILLSNLAFVVCIGSFVPSPGVAAGADQVGLTVTVRNSVNQVEPKTSKILEGDDVIRDEVVQTLQDSGAKFVLKDSTNLVLGPNSRLKLDKTVFSDQRSLGEIAIRLTAGSFRFITGQSAKEAYAISTPLATIGIRGTIIDARHEATQDTVRLNEGQARVCLPPPNNSRCLALVNVGDSVVISSNGDMRLVPSSPDSWSFDSACNGMCGAMNFAQALDVVTTGSLGGAGGGGGGGGTQSGAPMGGGANTGSLAFSSTAIPNTSFGLTTGGVGLGGGGFSSFGTNSFSSNSPTK